MGFALRAAYRRFPPGKETTAIRSPTPKTLELVLPEGMVVQVQVDSAEQGSSPFLLSTVNDKLVIVDERQSDQPQTSIDTGVVPSPAFYQLKTEAGTAMRDIASIRGGALSIDPAPGCSFASAAQKTCRLCRHEGSSRTEATSVDEVLEVVGAAFAEGAAEIVFFKTSAYQAEDGGFASIEPYIEAVKKHFDTLVALQGYPPSEDQWIDRSYASGVDALNYNVDVFESEKLAEHCPSRSAHTSTERHFEALEYAATIFPNGTVWSDLTVGLEDPASTREAIDRLTSMGVVPVLKPFRPWPQLSGAQSSPLTEEETEDLYAHLYRAVRDARINVRWMRDLGYGLTPMEARFFAGEGAAIDVAASTLSRSPLGSRAVRSLSRLRRRLRVRRVGESFDSSHL